MAAKKKTKKINHFKKVKILILGLLICSIFYLINRKIFFLAVFTVLAAYIKYMRCMTRIPIVFEPVFFLSMMLTRMFGFMYGLILAIFCAIAIDLASGDITMNTIINIIVMSVLNLGAFIVAGMPNILTFGLITSILNMVASFALGILIGGVPPDRLIMMPITNFLFNISYFLTFGEILEKIMVV